MTGDLVSVVAIGSSAGKQPELSIRLDECLESCRKASTSEQHASAWGSLIECIQKIETSQYQFGLTTVRQVLMEFPYMTPAYKTRMDRLLDACGISVALSTCCRLLKELGSSISNTNGDRIDTKLPLSNILEACWSTLQRLLLSKNQESTKLVWSSFFESNNHKIELQRLVKLVLSIPLLMANACHICKVRLPLLATVTKFYPRLVDCSWSTSCSTRENENVDDNYSNDCGYRIALLKALLANRNNAKPIALGLASHHPLPGKLLLPPHTPWSGRELSNLLLAFLQHCATTHAPETAGAKNILKTCHLLLQQAPVEYQEVVVQHLVLNNVTDDLRMCPLFIRLLKDSGILHSSLCDIAEAWSNSAFCHDNPTNYQRYVSQMLLEGLDQSPVPAKGELEDPLSLHLLQGVSHRLESFRTEIRVDGMRIGKQVALRMNEELHFDELAEWEEQQAAKSLKQNDSQLPLESPTINEQNKGPWKRKQRLKPKLLPDPDADYDSDEDDSTHGSANLAEDEDDDDSTMYDEELVPYSLEDDEDDLVETPKPIHLLHALELLRTSENDEHAPSHHDTAMRALPGLIRKGPDDLPDAAISLLLQILRMENKFGIDDFLQLRQASLVALTFMEPIQVGQQIVEEIFKDGTLSDRLACFGALQEAAYELSGSKDLDQRILYRNANDVSAHGKRALTHSEGRLQEMSSTGGETGQVARLETKTKRKRSARIDPILIRNAFTPIAPTWFYGLLGQFVKEKDKEALWNGSTGSQLLASLLRTLAVIVEFAGIASATILAKDLIELVLGFLDANVAEVRMSVLISVATSIAMLPDNQTVDILLRHDENLGQRIGSMSRLDPDNNCRHIATTISKSIADVVRAVKNPLIEA